MIGILNISQIKLTDLNVFFVKLRETNFTDKIKLILMFFPSNCVIISNSVDVPLGVKQN